MGRLVLQRGRGRNLRHRNNRGRRRGCREREIRRSRESWCTCKSWNNRRSRRRGITPPKAPHDRRSRHTENNEHPDHPPEVRVRFFFRPRAHPGHLGWSDARRVRPVRDDHRRFNWRRRLPLNDRFRISIEACGIFSVRLRRRSRLRRRFTETTQNRIRRIGWMR